LAPNLVDDRPDPIVLGNLHVHDAAVPAEPVRVLGDEGVIGRFDDAEVLGVGLAWASLVAGSGGWGARLRVVAATSRRLSRGRRGRGRLRLPLVWSGSRRRRGALG